MLGTTLGKYDGKKFIDNQNTSFGSDAKSGFFTGKPYVQGLGYTFLLRNYRSDLGKWQTQDPLGYPDGWNNLAYVNNRVTKSIDWLGGGQEVVVNYWVVGYKLTYHYGNVSTSEKKVNKLNGTVDNRGNSTSSVPGGTILSKKIHTGKEITVKEAIAKHNCL